MKKIIISLLMLMGITGVQAQEYEYVPLVREGVKWVFRYTVGRSPLWVFTSVTNEFKGDVTINGIQYKKCIQTIDMTDKDKWEYDLGDTEVMTIAYVREESKKVYAILTDEYRDFITSDGSKGFGIKGPNYELNGEYQIYDFEDPESFYSQINQFKGGASVEGELVAYDVYFSPNFTEIIEVNGTQRKKYELLDTNYGKHECWRLLTEGIGHSSVKREGLFPSGVPSVVYYAADRFLYPTGNCGFRGVLTHVIEDGKTVFKTPAYVEGITGVEDIKVETENKDNRYYNLMGQPVADPTQPGIYIHQGKKLVIK
ncbi:MAG: hypothetical protein J5523_03655 [Muribaculaceae bacterium]|nr:hypothetical protein [Muribaculaceae bacterium]